MWIDVCGVADCYVCHERSWTRRIMIINRIVLIVYALTLFVLYNFSYLLYVVIGKGIMPFHHCVFVQHVSCNISPRWYVFTILPHFNGLVLLAA